MIELKFYIYIYIYTRIYIYIYIYIFYMYLVDYSLDFRSDPAHPDCAKRTRGYSVHQQAVAMLHL